MQQRKMFLVALAVGFVALGFGQEKVPEEMKSGAPYVAIFPAPRMMTPRFEKDVLEIPFLSLGIDRVVAYQLYVFSKDPGKRRLVGSLRYPPVWLTDCTPQRVVYGIVAIDKSGAEGSLGKVSADYACAHLVERASRH